MTGENWQIVTNEPVEFEKQPVEVQDIRKITDHSRGIYKIYSNMIKETRRISTCNRLDLQTLGSQPVMPKNLPDDWSNKEQVYLLVGLPESMLRRKKNVVSDTKRRKHCIESKGEINDSD